MKISTKFLLALVACLLSGAAANADVAFNETTFPDSAFRAAVATKAGWTEGDLTDAQIAKVTALSIYNKGMKSIKGIEYLTALKTFYTYGNELGDVDLSGVTAPLTTISLGTSETYTSGVTSLKLGTGLTAVTTLTLVGNPITSLDVSPLAATLTTLNLNYTKLSEVNTSSLTKLKILSINGLHLTTPLDFTNNTALTTLNYGYTDVESLTLNCPSMTTVYLYKDSCLKTLDVTALTKMTSFNISYCPLSSIDVSKNTAMATFTANGTDLTSVDLTTNTALKYVSLEESKFESLSFPNQSQLTSLYVFSSPKLKSLDVTANPAITTLNAKDCAIESIDLSKNVKLAYLYLSNNKLAALDLTNCATTLKALWIDGNNFADGYDVSKLTAMITYYCNGNGMSSVDVQANTKLTGLNVSDNNLTKLDVAANTALTTLKASNNNLNSIDITANTKLSTFEVDNNGRKIEPSYYQDGATMKYYVPVADLANVIGDGFDMTKVNTDSALVGAEYGTYNDVPVVYLTADTAVYYYNDGYTGTKVAVKTAVPFYLTYDKVAPTAVNDVNATATVVRSEYYNLNGQKLATKPENCVVIRRDILSNGDEVAKKVVF